MHGPHFLTYREAIRELSPRVTRFHARKILRWLREDLNRVKHGVRMSYSAYTHTMGYDADNQLYLVVPYRPGI